MNVLLDGVPAGIDLGAVHDLHVWAAATDEVCASLHLTVATAAAPDAVRRAAAAMLHDRFGIGHSTIQTERADAACVMLAHA